DAGIPSRGKWHHYADLHRNAGFLGHRDWHLSARDRRHEPLPGQPEDDGQGSHILSSKTIIARPDKVLTQRGRICIRPPFFADWMTGSTDWTELRLAVDLRLGYKAPECLSSADAEGRRKSNHGWPRRGKAATQDAPSPPSDGGEGRGEEERPITTPLSSILSPLLRRGERKKKRAPENFRTPRKLLWIEVRMGTDGMRRAK